MDVLDFELSAAGDVTREDMLSNGSEDGSLTNILYGFAEIQSSSASFLSTVELLSTVSSDI